MRFHSQCVTLGNLEFRIFRLYRKNGQAPPRTRGPSTVESEQLDAIGPPKRASRPVVFYHRLDVTSSVAGGRHVGYSMLR